MKLKNENAAETEIFEEGKGAQTCSKAIKWAFNEIPQELNNTYNISVKSKKRFDKCDSILLNFEVISAKIISKYCILLCY